MQHSSRQRLCADDLHEPATAEGKCAQQGALIARSQSVPRGQLPPEATPRCAPLLAELQSMHVSRIMYIFKSLICGQGQAS